MHLDQQTIVVAMLVVFTSTLVMASGLVFALRASEAGRLWATGYVIASGAGLVLACAATAGAPQLGALGAGAYIIGRLTIYRGVRVYYGLAERNGLLSTVGIVTLTVLVIMAGLPDGRLMMHGLAYGTLALLSAGTIVALLLGGRVRRGNIGAPLVLVSHLVQLVSQCVALAGVLTYQGSPAVTPFVINPAGSPWVLAPLIATVLGLFGFTMMAMERIIAHNESGARTDALTGLLNRGALDLTAIGLVSRWQRDGLPLSCLVIDVDYFKQVNDRFGHHSGDGVLREIAQALDNSRRASDVAARYGGEEFCILCPHTDEHQASALANRILRKVRAVALPGDLGFASVSIGVAHLTGGPLAKDALWRGLFGEADRALYLAKQRGRDQVVLASTVPVPEPSVPEDDELGGADCLPAA